MRYDKLYIFMCARKLPNSQLSLLHRTNKQRYSSTAQCRTGWPPFHVKILRRSLADAHCSSAV